jgi:hypothetical protein
MIVKRLITTAVALAVMGTALVSVTGAKANPESVLERRWLEAEAKVRAHEEAIAACMAERGFEYIPTIPADVVLQREAVMALSRGLPPPDPAEVDIPEDPNAAVTSRLSDEAKEARAVAYWGTDEAPGCYASTYEEVWGVDPWDPALAAQVEDMESVIAADPRVREAVDVYVKCMGAAGITVSSTDEVYVRYVTAAEDLQEKRGAAEATDGFDAGQEALYDWWERVHPIHDRCIASHYEAEEIVRGEYLREHGIWD